jgi:chromate reductase, NAD(P)H dehydrogenase (quinone)
MAQYQIAVVVGSLRRESFNRKLANAVARLAPPEFTFTRPEIGDLPLYNQDDDANQSAPVKRLKSEIASSSGVLFVTAEYNRSIPGVLKNAIDWASRPPDQPFAGKPCAIIGAAAGMAGTARAQYDLRRSCVFLDMHPLNKPEVFIGQAQTKFDADGNLTDEAAKGFIRDMMAALAAWTRQVARKG